MAAVLTNSGRAIETNRMKGAGAEPLFMSWGSGAGVAAATDTTLFTERYSTTNDGTHNLRTTGVSSRVTTSVANDTYRVVATLVIAAGTGGITVTNVGLFDTNGQAADLTTPPSGGNIYSKVDFAGLPLNVGDGIQFTLDRQYT
jgi:hypothetical protein